jgi:hypothetical protein
MQLPVTCVTADIAGEIESPVYAVLQLGPEIDKIKIAEGYRIEQHMASRPTDPDRYSHEVGRRVAHHVRGLILDLLLPSC